MSELKPSSSPWAAKGSVLSVEGAQYNIAACPSQVVVDPTGAGDVFMGGFLTEYLRQKESVWCACVGSAAASLVVEGIGPLISAKKKKFIREPRLCMKRNLSNSVYLRSKIICMRL